MKFSVKSTNLQYLALGAGGIGLVLRAMLYLVAADPNGLLTRNHFLGISLWLLTAVALTGLYLLSRTIKGPESYQDCYHPSLTGSIGALAAAAALIITSASYPANGDRLAIICNLTGYLCAASLVVMALCRLTGSSSSFLLPATLCLHFALRMICQYRGWSSDPQLQNYCFQLLACVSLMLTAYHHAAFGAEMGNHKQLWFFSLISVFFCALSLAGPDQQLLYLGTGLWAFTNLTNLTPRKRRRPHPHSDEAPAQEE